MEGEVTMDAIFIEKSEAQMTTTPGAVLFVFGRV